MGGKGKGKGKGLKKKGKKNKKGRNLNKSEKKGDRKKKGDQKKKGRKNKANGGKNKDRKAAKKADKKEKKKARKDQKKAKKDRKNNNNKRVNIGRQSSCANETCIDNAVTYMKQLKLAVKNFGKQYNRILTNAKQSSGKSSKNNEFAPYLVKLRETGGGNASNLTCNGQKNQGAVNLETLYNNLATCETIINATCHTDNMPDVNMTFLDGCKATMDNFTAKANEAIKASGADACLIWQSAELAEMSGMLKGCSVKSLESTHTAAKKACTGNFSYCRQEEDKVSKIVSACSASNSKNKGNGNGKGKGKGKNLKNKGKKNKKGRNLKKSDKKGAGKKKGDKKKKGRKNGAQKGKKNGKKNGKGKNRKNGAKKNNKKQKGLKKSRKNKANGAGKNKDKKKARKAAKKADKKEKKKARKQEKKEQKKSRKNRKNNNNRVNIGRSSCMNATCIDNAITYMKQLKLAVKNFGKQYNRISTNAKQSSGKSSKYDEFAPYLIKLRETGGGNASNLTCNGEKNQGATNLKTLYDNLATCETIINSTCNTGMPDVNMTFLDACKATMDNFTV